MPSEGDSSAHPGWGAPGPSWGYPPPPIYYPPPAGYGPGPFGYSSHPADRRSSPRDTGDPISPSYRREHPDHDRDRWDHKTERDRDFRHDHRYDRDRRHEPTYDRDHRVGGKHYGPPDPVPGGYGPPYAYPAPQIYGGWAPWGPPHPGVYCPPGSGPYGPYPSESGPHADYRSPRDHDARSRKPSPAELDSRRRAKMDPGELYAEDAIDAVVNKMILEMVNDILEKRGPQSPKKSLAQVLDETEPEARTADEKIANALLRDVVAHELRIVVQDAFRERARDALCEIHVDRLFWKVIERAATEIAQVFVVYAIDYNKIFDELVGEIIHKVASDALDEVDLEVMSSLREVERKAIERDRLRSVSLEKVLDRLLLEAMLQQYAHNIRNDERNIAIVRGDIESSPDAFADNLMETILLEELMKMLCKGK